MNYYFLAASLPSLSLDSPPPLSFDQFRALCAEHFTPGEMRALDELRSPVTEDARDAFVSGWRHREVRLRNAVARARAARLQKDPAACVREQQGFDASEERAVADAFAKNTPADRELALDRFRWKQIEELAGFDMFSPRALLAYGLKLRLAERWAGMSEEKGRAQAEEMVGRGQPARAQHTP